MIRVKVLSIRKILKNIFCLLGVIIFILGIILVTHSMIKLESRTFAYNLVNETLNLNTLQKNSYVRILTAELGIEKDWLKSERNLYYKEIVEKVEMKNDKQHKNQIVDEISVDKDYSKYISNSLIRTWDRPKVYNVMELSSGKIQVGNMYISNYSKLKLNYNELSKTSNFKFDEKTNILILHTHTSEAYAETGEDKNFRTLNDSENIVSVGNVLEQNLLLKNFKVKHSITKHDTPSYNGAYKASLATVEEELKNEHYDMVLDIHRDALSGNLNFRPTAEINGETAAKLMFVVGTNASGVTHDNWMENLKLAMLIQNTANEMYPGLFRDLNLSKSRYNQHVSSGALILEVGATGNTLEEVWTSMKYFSDVLQALKQK